MLSGSYKQAGSNGFTLLEVIIGMSLLSVMMLLLFGSLRICVQNWDAGERKISEVSRSAVIQQFFSTRLESILPLKNYKDPSQGLLQDQPELSFQGDKNHLEFVSAMPASAGRLGIQKFSIDLIESRRSKSRGETIAVSIKPFFPVLEDREWDDESVAIVENVNRMEFTYFGAEKANEEPEWRDEWIEMKKLPELISVVIELSNGEVWPEIMVAPRIDSRGVVSNIFGIEDGRFTNNR